ncbi:MAG TPA: type IVB secretion system protein IcmH/DotU [Burkholderiales bacterium]|nr:type IVB secretion system protein IcmH/DotU [Burkholderiales bacterium]
MSERAQQADDADATVVLPTPGRKRSAFAPAIERQAASADLAALGGLNPLVEAANPILAAVPQIRHALRHPDPAALRTSLREQVDGFERSAIAAGIPDDQMQTARFALCALLDDSVAATPWGREWAGKGLLKEVTGEDWGGEKFFTLLDEMLAAPDARVEVIEFFYACLALGFEGKYRSGERQGLAQVRTKVYEFIEQRQGKKSTELSARWRGAQIRAKRVPGALALWGAASACALILAGLYFGYSVLLGARSDPVARELARLKLPPISIAAAAAKPAAQPAGPSATEQLAKAIGNGDVEVSQVPGGTLILLKGDQLFAPGSARPDSSVQPVIEHVAQALDKLPGAVLVTGHTDDQPIRSARFPSNWELSTERARNVVGMMAAEMKDPARLRAEGLADSEPLVPNDSPANRAKNRRVAIILRSGS